jgi:hypothetical protein
LEIRTRTNQQPTLFSLKEHQVPQLRLSLRYPVAACLGETRQSNHFLLSTGQIQLGPRKAQLQPQPQVQNPRSRFLVRLARTLPIPHHRIRPLTRLRSHFSLDSAARTPLTHQLRLRRRLSSFSRLRPPAPAQINPRHFNFLRRTPLPLERLPQMQTSRSHFLAGHLHQHHQVALHPSVTC